MNTVYAPYNSDEFYVNAYVDGSDKTAISKLYERYFDKVYARCLGFCNDPSIAYDLAAELWIKIMSKLNSFRAESTFSTWLFSFTSNHCIDYFRKTKKAESVSLKEVSYSLADEVEEDYDDDREQSHEDRIEKLTNMLQTEEFALLREKYVDGASIKDLCEKYNLSESAVKMRLKRTREKLQSAYAA